MIKSSTNQFVYGEMGEIALSRAIFLLSSSHTLPGQHSFPSNFLLLSLLVSTRATTALFLLKKKKIKISIRKSGLPGLSTEHSTKRSNNVWHKPSSQGWMRQSSRRKRFPSASKISETYHTVGSPKMTLKYTTITHTEHQALLFLWAILLPTRYAGSNHGTNLWQWPKND